MRARHTLVLLVVLAALVAAYWAMLHFEESAHEKEAEAKQLFAFAPEDIQDIRIVRAEGPAVAVTRSKDGPWAMVEPYTAIEPNQGAWRRIEKALVELSNERLVEQSPEDFAKYGLDAPRAAVALRTKAGEEARIIFGNAEPTRVKRYAQLVRGEFGGPFGGVEGAPVVLVADTSYREFDRPLQDLRERHVFDIGEEGITRVEYVRLRARETEEGEPAALELPAPLEESVPMIVERSEDGTWRLLEPVEALADQERVADLTTELRFAVGRDYVDRPEDLSDYGLAPPAARVTVVSGDEGVPQVLYLGWLDTEREKGGLLVKRESSPAVFTIDGHLLTLLPQSPDHFRERHLITRPTEQLRRIRYVEGDRAIVLEDHPQRGWGVAEPAVDDSDQFAISRYIGVLKDATAVEFLDGVRTEYGFDNPTFTISFEYADQPETRTVIVGARTTDKEPDEPTEPLETYYATQDTGVPVMVAGYNVQRMRAEVFDFRDKRLLKFKNTEAARIELAVDGARYVFEKTHGAWRLTKPEHKRIERSSDVESLVKALCEARADALERQTPPDDAAAYGLDAPSIRVSVFVAEDGRTERLLGPLTIGATDEADPHVRFATIEGRPEVFRVKQAVVDSIRECLRHVRDRNV